MAKFANVVDGIVVNIIEADGTWQPTDGIAVPADDNVSIGWTYAEKHGFALPLPVVVAVPVPEAVAPAQARLALARAGLLDAVNKAVSKHPSNEVRIVWEYATAIRRDSPFIAAMAGALGLSSEQLDDLFRAAAAIP